MQKFYTVVIMMILTLIVRAIINRFSPGLGNFVALYSLVNCILGLIPAWMASRNGGSFIKWWVFGWLLFVPAVVGVMVFQKKANKA